MGSPPTTPPRVMRGCTAGAAGAAGYLPAFPAGDQDKIVHADGTARAVTNAVAATDAQAAAGTSTTTFVTPANAALAASRALNTRAPRGGLAFDGTTGANLSTALTSQVIDADPFSINWAQTIPTASPATAHGLIALSAAAAADCTGANALFVVLTSAGKIELNFNAASSTHQRYCATSASVVSEYGGKTVVMTLFRPTSGQPLLYINGVLQSLTADSTSGTPPTNWQATVASAYIAFGRVYTGSSYQFVGTIYSASLYNCSLSQADVTEIQELGCAVPERFRSGSQVAITSGSLTIGKAYRITAAGGTFTGVGAADNSVGTTFVATGTAPTWSTGAVVRAGAVVHYDADLDGIGYQLHDQGTNKLHALLTTTSPTWTKQATMGYVKVLSDGTTAAQALGGGTILPANCQIIRIRARSISGTPNAIFGTSSGGSQIVASVALSTTWKDLTIALTGGINTTAASLWMTASAANVIEVQLAYEQLPA